MASVPEDGSVQIENVATNQGGKQHRPNHESKMSFLSQTLEGGRVAPLKGSDAFVMDDKTNSYLHFSIIMSAGSETNRK